MKITKIPGPLAALKKPLIFIDAYPVEYISALFKGLVAADINLQVWYCSALSKVRPRKASDPPENSLGGKACKEKYFHNWGIPYRYEPAFFSLVNPGLLLQLLMIQKSVVVVRGWEYFTHLMAVMIASWLGHTVCVHSEASNLLYQSQRGLFSFIKKLVLKYLIFPRIKYFLCTGAENRLLYKKLGIGAKRLRPAPFAVDNAAITQAAAILLPIKASNRRRFGIPEDSKVILFYAPFVHRSRPMEMIRAFEKLAYSRYTLIMAGNGPMTSRLERYIARKNLSNIRIFPAQKPADRYVLYSLADLFVCTCAHRHRCSSTSEAIHFGLPLILTDTNGGKQDLLHVSEKIFTFQTGNICALTSTIEKASQDVAPQNRSFQVAGLPDYTPTIATLQKLL